MKSLIIRADANTRVGNGHLMRCLALAQTWQNAVGHVVFATAMESSTMEGRFRSEGVEVAHIPAQPGTVDDAIHTTNLAQNEWASWVVLDGYQFGANYQQTIKDADLNLLFIDDNQHADHYYADLVLNQNLHAHEDLYTRREPYTRLLLGTRYVLLRREFWDWRGWKRKIPERASRILVTLGGSDPENVTLKIIDALKRVSISDLDVKIVAGPSYPHMKTLQNASSSDLVPLSILQDVRDMAKMMAWADVAVSAGGSTCWEMAFMGVPFLVVILAENQEDIAAGLAESEVALNHGWFHTLSAKSLSESFEQLIGSETLRAHCSAKGQGLVDGLGTERIINHMAMH